MAKKALIVRLGAYGDIIITTPLIRRLKYLGYDVYYNCTERGEEVLRHHPVELVLNKTDEVSCDKLHEHIEKLKDDIKPDFFVDLTESLETSLCFHPKNPQYVYTKKERGELANKNYYEHTMDLAGFKYTREDLIPDLYFTKLELENSKYVVDRNKFNILWCLSGSGSNKAWPWTHKTWEKLFQDPTINIITVGDKRCEKLETHPDLIKLSGKFEMRLSMALTQFVDLVISPDTGTLHASGCYKTPKIGILGHTNIENITKHFYNDFSIQSSANCSPCFRLIYHSDLQCPLEPESHASLCMSEISMSKMIKRIKHVRSIKEVRCETNVQYAVA